MSNELRVDGVRVALCSCDRRPRPLTGVRPRFEDVELTVQGRRLLVAADVEANPEPTSSGDPPPASR